MKKSILTFSALALTVSLSVNAQDAGDVQVSGSIAPTPCTLAANTNNIALERIIFTDIPTDLTAPHVEQLNAISFDIVCSSDTDIVFTTQFQDATSRDVAADTLNPNLDSTIIPFNSRAVLDGFGNYTGALNIRHNDRARTHEIWNSSTNLCNAFGSNTANSNILSLSNIRGWCYDAVANTALTIPLDVGFWFDSQGIPNNDTTNYSADFVFQIFYR